MSDVAFIQALRDNGFEPPDNLKPPQVLVHFGDAVGDDLLCTAVLRELRRRGATGLWMMTRYPELFVGNPDVEGVVPISPPFAQLVQQFGGQLLRPLYTRHDFANDAGDPIPPAHIIAVMCSRVGITGKVALTPHLSLSPEESTFGQYGPRQIAIQSSGLGATFPMRNKEWVPERFQQVIDTLGSEFTFVQLGSPQDPPLHGAIDLRGKTTIRETAAVLANSLLFVGLVGFLMHLSRAVRRRAVIVYGGRELPSQSGYSCNENIADNPPCSPCWRWNNCGHDHRCMTEIAADVVVAAVRRQLTRAAEPVLDDGCEIGRSPVPKS